MSFPVLGEDYRSVQLAAITAASPMQTRALFAPERDEEDQALVNSLRADGQRVPVLLAEIEDAVPAQFRLLDGHRRVAALRHLGAEAVKAVIRQAGSLEGDLTTLAANVRKNLTPLEQARAIERLHATHGLSWNEIAGKTGLTRRYLLELHGLVQADPAVQLAVERGAISARAGLALKRAPRAQQPTLAALAEPHQLSGAQAGQLVERVRAGAAPESAAVALGLGLTDSGEAVVPAVTQAPSDRAALRALYPELAPAALDALWAAAGAEARLETLKLAGLLVLAGLQPAEALAATRPVVGSQPGHKLEALIERLAEFQARPDWLGAARGVWLAGLERKLAALMRPSPGGSGGPSD